MIASRRTARAHRYRNRRVPSRGCARTYCRALAELRRLVGENHLHVQAMSMSTATPFANVLLGARAR